MKMLMLYHSVTATFFTDGSVVTSDDGDLVIGPSQKATPNYGTGTLTGDLAQLLIADKRYIPDAQSRPPIPPPEEFIDGRKNWHGRDGSQWKWAAHRNAWRLVAR